MSTDLDLSFRFDEETFLLYLTFRPESVELEELRTFFFFPFRLKAGDTELFWSPPEYDEEDSYLPALPLLDFVLNVQAATLLIEERPLGYRALVELDTYGNLTLTRPETHPDRLRLYTSMTSLQAEVPLQAWHRAVTTLVEETQELLLRRLPALEKNPFVGPWLKTGVLPPEEL